MIRRMTICTAGFLLFSLLVAVGPAMAQRGSEGTDPETLANLINGLNQVNPHAKGVALTGKLSIRYSLVDFAVLDCGESDAPFNMFYQVSLRLGLINWNFFGYGGTTCYVNDLEGQAAALRSFISSQVIPNMFPGPQTWAFKSISNFTELPGGLDGFGGLIEETTLADFTIAVKPSRR